MKTKLSVGNALLDTSLSLRPLRMEDAGAVAELIYAACAAEGDAIAAMSAQELMQTWQVPGFHIGTDAFAVETPEGRILGYAELMNEYEFSVLNMNGNVHPDFKGRGIATTLLRAVEQRARELIPLAEQDARVAIETTINRNDPDSVVLHENEGYRPAKYHWRMEIVLDGPPSQPKLPAGIELRPFIQGEHDAAVWKANTESFRDHPGSHGQTLEEWRSYRFDDPEYDPSLWQIAWDGNEVAGFALNRYRMGIGWVRTLGVRRPWRKHGLGEALLLQSFGEYYRRGMKTVGLGVNANNPTGAQRLYQRVGMHAASEHVTYAKELRPGRAPENE
jgi:mycothiol synthase